MIGSVGKKLIHGGKCDLCENTSRCPILTLCGHILCPECTEKSMTGCAKCGERYELDEEGYPEELIELQPSYSQVRSNP